jgi:DNA-binding MarR family transcriptional regulator
MSLATETDRRILRALAETTGAAVRGVPGVTSRYVADTTGCDILAVRRQLDRLTRRRRVIMAIHPDDRRQRLYRLADTTVVR